jgi:tetratricopeptide (TPR) repeat protein
LGDAKRDQFAQQNPNYSSGIAQPNQRYSPGHQPYGYNATPSYAPIYNDYYAAPLYYDANEYADIHFNRRYYDDGPNGPGYYYKDEWYNWYIANKRSEQLIDANRFITDEGMAFFSAGNYERAAVVWLNSASIHHGDAVSRLNAGHALFAIGRYADAISLLARAFELSPQLAGANYDIRDNYVIPGDFERHLARLQSFAKRNPNDLYGQLMMGYVMSYTQGPSHAYAYLQRSRQIVPNDPFIEKLWSFAVMIGPAVEIPEVDRINQRPPQLPSYVPEQSSTDQAYGTSQPLQSMRPVEQPAPHIERQRPPAHISPQNDNPRQIDDKQRDGAQGDRMRLVRADTRHI